VYSLDSKYFALRTTIGADATNAKLFRLEDGENVATFPHDSSVRDLYFSEDGKYVYTCSRSGELKVWSIAKDGDLVLSAKQNEPIAGVLPHPENSNLLITIDRKTNARIWDVRLGRIIDGPFRGVPGCDYWFIKLHSSRTMKGFVGYYGPTALAYWPEPLSFNYEMEIDEKMIEFSKIYIGGQMDENSSFKVLNLSRKDLKAQSKEISPQDPILSQWKSWLLKENKNIMHSPNIGMSKLNYISFLKRQNTKQSLEEGLMINSNDSELLRLYGLELLDRSKAEGLNKQVSDTLSKRANWYINRSKRN